MRPKPLPSRGDDLSRSRLDAIIDARHPLVQLAGLIHWARFDAAFGSRYAETGRPGLPTRLMVGLHLLKHMKGLSDEEVCAQWVENLYMQVYRPRFVRHRIGSYAASAAGESWFCRTAAGVWNPCRSMSQVVL